jgi:hypothetical protein
VLAAFAATFLHEVGHMASNTANETIAFGNELSRLLGLAATAPLRHSRQVERHTAQDLGDPR